MKAVVPVHYFREVVVRALDGDVRTLRRADSSPWRFWGVLAFSNKDQEPVANLGD
jgi:IS4 transposase